MTPLETEPVTLDLRAFLPWSRANGPGRRCVVWFQGCTLGCPECFNPETHGTEPRLRLKVPALVQWILQSAKGSTRVDGLSVSGGEPLQQAEGLLELLRGVRRSAPALSVLLFSGFTLEEILRLPSGREILSLVDVLLDGRYDPSQRIAKGLRGSANQRIHLLTDRYRLEEVEATPPAEVVVHSDGKVSATGIAPLNGAKLELKPAARRSAPPPGRESS